MDYIKQAVELADGWSYNRIYIRASDGHHFGTWDSQVMLDALAAQLVRQAYGHCVRPIKLADPIHYDLYDPINTIKEIIDSGMLKS